MNCDFLIVKKIRIDKNKTRETKNIKNKYLRKNKLEKS